MDIISDNQCPKLNITWLSHIIVMPVKVLDEILKERNIKFIDVP